MRHVPVRYTIVGRVGHHMPGMKSSLFAHTTSSDAFCFRWVENDQSHDNEDSIFRFMNQAPRNYRKVVEGRVVTLRESVGLETLLDQHLL